MHWEPHEFSLPNLPRSGTWDLAINTDDGLAGGIYPEGEERMLEDQKLYEVPARTILVFIGKCLPETKEKKRKKRPKHQVNKNES